MLIKTFHMRLSAALVLVIVFFASCTHSTINPLTNERLHSKVRSINESYYPAGGTSMPQNPNSQSTNYYAFDADGNMTEAKVLDKNESGGTMRLYEFKNGKPTGGIAKGSNTDGDYTISVTYNGDGKLVEEKHAGKDFQEVFRYEYDLYGNRKGLKWYNDKGELVATFTNKLDGNGNITGQGIVYATDNVHSDYTYKYDSLDSKGNWVKRTVYSYQTPITTAVRKIEYY